MTKNNEKALKKAKETKYKIKRRFFPMGGVYLRDNPQFVVKELRFQLSQEKFLEEEVG